MAAELAIEATKSFFDDLRSVIGDDRFARFLNLQAVRTLSLVIDDTGSMISTVVLNSCGNLMKQLRNSLFSLTIHIYIFRCQIHLFPFVGVQRTSQIMLMDILPIELTSPSFNQVSLAPQSTDTLQVKKYISGFIARLNTNSLLKGKLVFPSVQLGTGEHVGWGKQLDGCPSGNLSCNIF